MVPTSHYAGGIEYKEGQRESIFKKLDERKETKTVIPREEETQTQKETQTEQQDSQ